MERARPRDGEREGEPIRASLARLACVPAFYGPLNLDRFVAPHHNHRREKTDRRSLPRPKAFQKKEKKRNRSIWGAPQIAGRATGLQRREIPSLQGLSGFRKFHGKKIAGNGSGGLVQSLSLLSIGLSLSSSLPLCCSTKAGQDCRRAIKRVA